MQSVNGSEYQGQKMGRVINSRDIPHGKLPADTVYIDHGTEWANPFRIGVHGDRDEVCDRYDLALAMSPAMLERIDALKGKDLITFHAPKRNHGDTLVMLAAMNYRQRLEWADKILGHTEPMALAA